MPKNASRKMDGASGGGSTVKMPGSVKYGSSKCAGKSMKKMGQHIGENPKYRRIVGA